MELIVWTGFKLYYRLETQKGLYFLSKRDKRAQEINPKAKELWHSSETWLNYSPSFDEYLIIYTKMGWPHIWKLRVAFSQNIL